MFLLDFQLRDVCFRTLRFVKRRDSLTLTGTRNTKQISSWWGGSGSSAPAVQDKPYDPTDPKQNPLNPKGLKPYVLRALLLFDSAKANEEWGTG